MRPSDRSGIPLNLVITGVGLVTAIGDDAESSAASLECGLSGMRTISIPDRGGNELIGCPAIEVEPLHVYVRRLWDFALRAAKEAIDKAHLVPNTRQPCKYHIFWTLPARSRVGYKLEPSSEYFRDFVRELDLPLVDVVSYEVPSGQASAVAAMAMANSVIVNDENAICLIGGADTLIQLRVLRWLERSSRLKTELWPDGLIPGEAGAFLLVESLKSAMRRGAPSLCHIDHIGYQGVENQDVPMADTRSERLTKVLRMALPLDDLNRKRIKRLYCDLNGESIRALEWGLASVRVLDTQGVTPDIVHPADCLGDVGAVSATMNIGLAALWMRESEPDSRFMVFAASETGERAALSALRTTDCPTPQIRQNTSIPNEYQRLLSQNFDEVSFLWSLRHGRLTAPDSDLKNLALIDRRLSAHARALFLAGDSGWQVTKWTPGSSAFEGTNVGEIFAISLRAIEDRNLVCLENLLVLAETIPESHLELISAFGWVSAQFLKGIVKELLLESNNLFRRQVGIASCAMHRVDPGAVLTESINNPEPLLRVRALRAAGELGQRDLLAACIHALQDEDASCRFWAAWSGVLLGDRNKAVKVLENFVLLSNAFRQRALTLLLKVLDLPSAQQLLKTIAQDPANKRLLIKGAGTAGDVQYLPWLIGQMANNQFARLAGESFTTITGVNLSYLDLERKPPEDFEAGPNENPEDENVEMDPDNNLPWPDATKIQQWWTVNDYRFQSGVRYFMGAVPTKEHCLQVLKEACQRQRMSSAEYLCILAPGTQLFPTTAPTWRQKRWLEKMG